MLISSHEVTVLVIISYHIKSTEKFTLRYLYRISICWEKLELNVLASPRQSKRVTSGKPTWNKDTASFISNVTKIKGGGEEVRSMLLCSPINSKDC